MSMYPTKAPHITGARDPLNVAPNAALLIDFDNVTMGMRSDLSKELKTLLNSDIIKGKVTVQRAYADWRRYPQYIVPLSEASIDLIFAPAYGSNKKNATDIRMAIDGIELVFIRPEIGTFILLTGDSDFSSLVLKLKEYGKYVIGVGIQESSSDILVQNCDEYYSYTSLSGLRKTSDSDPRQAIDPWVLVERAVDQMVSNDDVMRSDRLKQVMVELDPGFDEGEYGFSKFSRFLTEASSKGLLHIKKLDNGQYEVSPSGRRVGGPAGEERTDERPPREERSRGGRGRGRDRGRDDERRRVAPPPVTPSVPEPTPEIRDEGRGRRERVEESATPVVEGPPLRAAYDLLTRALERMLADGREAVRDSDVKRKMLELEPGFDETTLGFSKFSRFLNQAHDHEIIELHKRDSGNFEVTLRRAGARAAGAPAPRAEASPATTSPQPPAVSPATRVAPASPEPPESMLTSLGRRFGFLPPRPQAPVVPAPSAPQVSRPSIPSAPPAPQLSQPSAAPAPQAPQISRPSVTPAPPAPYVSRPAAPPAPPAPTISGPPAPRTSAPSTSRPSEQGASDARVDARSLGLPTDADAQVRYLTGRYKGVGQKTAEKLVEGFGEDLFTVLQREPQRVQDVIPSARAETVLEQWKVDYDRRRSRIEGGTSAAPQGGGRDDARRERPRGDRGGQRRAREEGERRPAESAAAPTGAPVAAPLVAEPVLAAASEPVFARTDPQPTREEQVYATAHREAAAPPVEAVTTPAPRVDPLPSEPAAAALTTPAEATPDRAAVGPRVEPTSQASKPEEPSSVDGLEPSRLRGRTSRGRRR